MREEACLRGCPGGRPGDLRGLRGLFQHSDQLSPDARAPADNRADSSMGSSIFEEGWRPSSREITRPSK